MRRTFSTDPNGDIAAPLPAVVLLGVILLLALGLRLHDLGGKSFWGDEVHTVRRGGNLREVVLERRLAPLYVVTSFVLFFNEGELAVRLPHALLGAASVFLLYRLGMAYLGRWMALSAAFLLAIAPLHIHHSREARYYSLMVFFSLLSLLFLGRGLDERRKRWFAAFGIVSILNVHNHPFSAILFGAQVPYAWLVWKWGARKPSSMEGSGSPPGPRSLPWLKALGVLAAGALIVYWLRPKLWQSVFRWTVDAGEGRFSLALTPDFFEHFAIWFGAGPGLPLAVHVSLFAIGVIVLAARRRQALLLAVLTLAMTLGGLQVGIWVGPGHPFYLRYLSFLLPIYLLVVAAGAHGAAGLLVSSIGIRAGRGSTREEGLLRGSLSLLLVMGLFACLNFRALVSSSGYKLADYRGAVDFIYARASPGDAVAMPDQGVSGHHAGLKWYLTRRGKPGSRATLEVVNTREEVAALAGRHPRVWLLEFAPAGPDSVSSGAPRRIDPALEAWVKEHAVEVGRIPNSLWSERLGPPELKEVVVVRVAAAK